MAPLAGWAVNSSGRRPSSKSCRKLRVVDASKLRKGASAPPTTIPFLYTVNSTVTRVGWRHVQLVEIRYIRKDVVFYSHIHRLHGIVVCGEHGIVVCVLHSIVVCGLYVTVVCVNHVIVACGLFHGIVHRLLWKWTMHGKPPSIATDPNTVQN